MASAPKPEYHRRQLLVPDVLEAFDAWDYEAWRPTSRSYGAVVMFTANRLSFEELVRAVLRDQGIDPELWQEYTDVVAAAHQEWLRLDAPYVRPRRSGVA